MTAARAVLLAAMLAIPALLSGCILASAPLIVAASAPKAASGMTLFLVTETTLLDSVRGDHDAEYLVYFGDRLVYPAGGRGASFPVEGRTGTAFVPYANFVVGNGEYDVIVRYGGAEARTRVHVEKWAEYVYLHPFDKGDVVVVEAALSSATGGRPDDRILARGELVLTLRYHGEDKRQDRPIAQFTVTTRNDQTSTDYEVPRSRFSAGTGYYSFVPLFHNAEARDNVQVGPDPTMANMDPPWNWIRINNL